MSSSYSYHTHTYTQHTHWPPSWEKRWRRVCMETFQPCDLITIPNQRWEDEHCCVPSTTHPELKEMMCMNGRVVRWAASSPISPYPPLPPATLHAHFLSGDSRLCFLSGCPRPQTRGASRSVGIWSSLSKVASLFSTHEKENKTWGWHYGSSSVILSHIVFAACLSYAYFHFPSSLSSTQAINSVNWLTPSLMHWLWSLIKGLLIGTLFNTGPCRGSCPLILSRQQPFLVCQSLNVINYVSRLSR